MASVNKVILIGNLGKDPETKYTPAGVQITKFSVATTDKVKKGDTYEDKTEWHNIVTFNKTAEIANEYLKKGSSVYIEGKISTNTWEDQAGEKKFWTEIICNNLTMLGKKETQTPTQAPQNSQAPQVNNSQVPATNTDDNLPFSPLKYYR